MKTNLVGNTHIVAGENALLPKLFEFLKQNGIEARGNPDVYVRRYKQFGIEEARELRERAALKAAGERRVFIVVAPDINREAQNALLKTLEEPPANALFFFVLHSPQTLLPTFLSRTQTLDLAAEADETIAAGSFLSAPIAKRLDMVKNLLEKDEDERRDLGAILTFLSSLERTLEKSPDGLRAVYRARKYVTDKGALVKPLLEQVAILVPKL